MSEQTFDTTSERYRELKNGAVYDMETKRIVANPGGGKSAITQATSSELRARWAEKKLEAQLAAQRGIGRLVSSGSDLEAWEAIVEQQGTLAMDIEQGRASTEAARFTGLAAGYLSDRRGGSQDPAPGGVNITLGAGVVRELLDVLRESRVSQDESDV